jgi:hypothetical protein
MYKAEYVGSLAAAGIEAHAVARLVAGWEYADDDEWAGGFIVELKLGGFAYVYGGQWKDKYSGHPKFFAECPAKETIAWLDFGAGSKELSDDEVAAINEWHEQDSPAQVDEDDHEREQEHEHGLLECEHCERIAIERMEDGYQPSNREKTLTPKRKTSFWCGKCDAALVRPGAKCPNCQAPNGKKRFKK